MPAQYRASESYLYKGWGSFVNCVRADCDLVKGDNVCTVAIKGKQLDYALLNVPPPPRHEYINYNY